MGPVVGLADLQPDSSANGTGGDYGNSRAATSSPGQSAGGVCALPEPEADAAETQPGSQQQQEGGQQQEGRQQQQQDNEQDDDSYSGDEEDEDGEAQDAERGAGDPWVASLLTGSYACLGLSDRIAALSFLCHAVLDGPTLRTKLELRTNDAVLRRKQVFEEAKVGSVRIAAEPPEGLEWWLRCVTSFIKLLLSVFIFASDDAKYPQYSIIFCVFRL